MVRPFSVRSFERFMRDDRHVDSRPMRSRIRRGDEYFARRFHPQRREGYENSIDDDVEEPTERLPKALIPYIGAAHKRGALKIFGSAIDHEQVITRGEAISVLMKLQSLGGSIAVGPEHSAMCPRVRRMRRPCRWRWIGNG